MESKEYVYLKVSDINIDTSYQRNVSTFKVKQIIRDFNMNAFGAVFVNKRSDGKYYLVDGQHRIVAANQLSIKEVPCFLTNGLTQQEEANLFLTLSIVRKAPKSQEKWKTAIVAEKENIINIIDILNKFSLKPNLLDSSKENTRKQGYISSLSTIEDIYKSKGSKWFENMIKIISLSWMDENGTFDPDSLSNEAIDGMYLFLSKAKDIDEKYLVEKMKKTPAKRLKLMAKQNQMNLGKSLAVNYARAILQTYNCNKKYKLDILFS